jgi:hypothetical protein
MELQMSDSPAMPVSLLEWKSLKKNSLRGFATVRIGKSMKVSDVPVHCSGGRRWASLPSKPQINSDGVALRDDRGKIKYIPIVAWTDKDSADRFSEAVISAIEADHPGDTQADS